MKWMSDTALLAERSMHPVELARRTSLTPSTVYSFLDPNRREATINVIQKICEGLGVSVAEFFDDEVFKNSP
jgi:DNA-binding Xre family transcriptional regulator